MLEETIRRILPLIPRERMVVVTSRELTGTIVREIPGTVLPANILGEPRGRNTALAIGLAAVTVAERDASGLLIVLPADHHLKNERVFLSTLKMAVRMAREGMLLTIGVAPTRPDTGYGYIEIGDEIARQGRRVAFEVMRFREKPDRAMAEEFVASGRFFWNSGMFVFGAEAILESFRRHLPQLFRGLEQYRKTRDVDRLYRTAESISIDYGIMEKAQNIAVIKGDFQWDDLGSWTALQRLLPRDAQGNCHQGEAVCLDTFGSVVYSDGGMVSTLGVSNVIIVKAGDAVLVCDKDRAGEVKSIVQVLNKTPRLRKYT